MKITYREVNGFLIPNLKLPPEEAQQVAMEVASKMWAKDYDIKKNEQGSLH